MLPPWLQLWGYIAACLLIPIAWGWLVNWLFVRWQRRRDTRFPSDPESTDQSRFDDYQI